ncbi:MAG: hypothetical protein K2O69_04705 [Odoribacter sp.]|nr:hypothetical protein [Odoribacter sp.]
MEHSEIVKKFIPIVQELYAQKGNDISEKDVQDAFIEKFNKEKHRKFYARKERENRRDIVIYRKRLGKTKKSIELVYELKTYLKSSEKIDTSKIEYDLYKLHSIRQEKKVSEACFIMISTREHLDYLKEHQKEHFINILNKRKKINIEYLNHKFNIQYSVSHEDEDKEFCILTWKAL